jgi:hypothetical protein
MDISTILISLGVAVVTGPIAAFITSRGIWKKARADLENEFSSRFNTRKWEVYTEFTKFLRGHINQDRNNRDNYPAEELASLASQVLLAGSDKVVKAFRSWLESIKVYGPGDDITRDKLFMLVLEMRRDLGNKKTRLESNDLWGALSLTSDD